MAAGFSSIALPAEPADAAARTPPASRSTSPSVGTGSSRPSSPVDLVIPRRGADHQALDRRPDLDDRVVDAARKAAELAGADRMALPLDLDHKRAAEDDEALVALGVGVRRRIAPRLVGVV